MMANLELTLRRDVLHVAIGGEIDLSNAGNVQRRIEEAMTNRISSVVVDLSRLRYLDSSGLRILFSLAEQAASFEARFKLIVSDESPVPAVIDAVGFEEVAEIERRPAESP